MAANRSADSLRADSNASIRVSGQSLKSVLEDLSAINGAEDLICTLSVPLTMKVAVLCVFHMARTVELLNDRELASLAEAAEVMNILSEIIVEYALAYKGQSKSPGNIATVRGDSEPISSGGASRTILLAVRLTILEIPVVSIMMMMIQEATINIVPDQCLEKATYLTELGLTLEDRYRCSDDIHDLEKAIYCKERAVSLTPEDQSIKALYIYNLGAVYDLLFDRTGDLSDIDKALLFMEQAITFVEDDRADKASYLSCTANSYRRRFEKSAALVDIDRAVILFEQVKDLIADTGHTYDTAEKSMNIDSLAVCLRMRSEHTGDLRDLERALSYHAQAVKLASDDDLDKPTYIANMVTAHLLRFTRLGELTDLDDSVALCEQAARAIPDGGPNKAVYLDDLATSYHRRFEYNKEISDLERAISTERQAVATASGASGGTEAAFYITNLGDLVKGRFELLGNVIDLEEAIALYRQASEQTTNSDIDKPTRLNRLADSLEARFNRLGERSDLEDAILLQETALHLTPKDDPFRASRLTNLGITYQIQWTQLGDVAALNKAISLKSEAIDLTPSGMSRPAQRLHNLAISLRSRFRHSGSVHDLEEAILLEKEAVSLFPDGDPVKPKALNGLGVLLENRFSQLGNRTDLDAAIASMEEAIALTPTGDSTKSHPLSNVADAYRVRFEQSGDLLDLDEAISSQERAIVLAPIGDPNKHISLNSLGIALQVRYERLGELPDINKAISSQEQALDLISNDHPNKPIWLSNLGTALQVRYDKSGQLMDLERAISSQEQAATLISENSPFRQTILANLGLAQRGRFERYRELGDLDSGIATMETATAQFSDDHPQKPAALNSLGVSLRDRFSRQAVVDPRDIESAMSHHSHAINITPEGHPDRSLYLCNLAMCFLVRAERLDKKADDTVRACSLYKNAALAQTGSLSPRLHAAGKWARLALENGDISSSMEAHRLALDLIPRIVWLGTNVENRYQDISVIGDAANEAAAVAIAAGEYSLALEWLEEGRSIVWGQLLRLRTPVEDLRTFDPTLADKLEEVGRSLDRAGAASHIMTASVSSEDKVQKRHRLAEEWQRLIDEARRIPGFEDFLQPKKIAHLSRTTHTGTVVAINVHRYRCDALILRPNCDEVMHVHLPRLSYARTEDLRKHLMQSLKNAGVRSRGSRVDPVRLKDGLRRVLAILWNDVVQPVLDRLSYLHDDGGELPHVTWCATGPLAFLPLHAAGIYGTPGKKIFNHIISSYTPIVTVLLPRPAVKFRGILAVSQPATPGHNALPKTDTEVEQVALHAHNQSLTELKGASATVDAVLDGMAKHSWIHLACHAIQDATDPLKSAFAFQDGMLDLATIMQKSLVHADFAFLSACQTASGDEKLPEEAVHLAAGMLMAGYRSVLATMWSIADADAPLIADEIYASLLKGEGEPDSGRAAYALHDAVGKLRERVGEDAFTRWVPFIHVGQ